MMKTYLKYKVAATTKKLKTVLDWWFVILGFLMMVGCTERPKKAIETNKLATISPAYYDLTIPPNIAPLNFVIKEPGSKFRIEISGDKGNPITIHQSSSSVEIPIKDWHKLLDNNKQQNINLDIWVFNDSAWFKYKRISHHVAPDPIDPYLAYRLVDAVYLMWRDMGIFQRNLTNFEESPIIENSSTDNGCVNCHSFPKNDPSKMLMHFRIKNAGTVILCEGQLSKINTKSPKAVSGGIYPSWHPDGKHIAFTVGQLSPHLTTRSEKVVDVSDKVSDLIIYDLDKNAVITPPELTTVRRENMPTWSADGKHLYYISAPEAIPGNLDSRLHSKYDLMCIPYDTEQDTCGEAQLVLSSEETGLSISMPVASPDGKYIVCSMSDYGYFTIFHKQSDLYLVNLKSKEYRKLGLNSNSAESHSTWSSNGRWLVFSSKRIDDVYSRPFIAYFDSSGVAHNPFVLPQKNPEMYELLLSNYNRPELITEKVDISALDLRDLVLDRE